MKGDKKGVIGDELLTHGTCVERLKVESSC